MRIQPDIARSLMVSLLAGCLLSGLAASAWSATFVTFDVPGNLPTEPSAINANGDVTGQYVDAGGNGHGFLRTSNGTITTFDAPGAILATFGRSIDTNDDIAGFCLDTSGHYHGFLRFSNGAFALFDAPGATNTVPYSINDAGVIAGYFNDASGLIHGFIRAANGTMTRIDAPGANQTIVLSMNATGDVIGYHLVTTAFFQGYIRSSSGTFTTFDVASSPLQMAHPETVPLGINSGGAVAGWATNNAGQTVRSFERDSSGNITKFDMPLNRDTLAQSINATGQIAGFFSDSKQAVHGFVRAANGTIASFDVPSATGTHGLAINDAGQITGFYNDTVGSGVHGYVRLP